MIVSVIYTIVFDLQLGSFLLYPFLSDSRCLVRIGRYRHRLIGVCVV